MWGDVVRLEGPDISIDTGPEGIWINPSTFALFWINSDGTSAERSLRMQRYTRTGLKLVPDGGIVNLGAVPITLPNAAAGGVMHVSLAASHDPRGGGGEVLISFTEQSVIFG